LDEKRIQQVLEIEKQAQAIYDAALAEATNIPIQAKKEAQALIEKTRSEAEAEARKIVADAQAKEECEQIIADAESKIHRAEVLTKGNFNRAVSYVIDRLTGKE
jgi:vacuolar-type H+-ATPase subunit H